MREQPIERSQEAPEATSTTSAEFDWLMSLALDDQLDPAAQARFAALLASEPQYADAWRDWQWIDREFEATPAVTPASGFVNRFALHLAEQEQQRQQRLLLLSVALALVASWLVFASTAGVGAFVFLTQGQWVGEQVRTLALAYTSVSLWLRSGGEALATLANTPQAQVAGALYALVIVLMVTVWIRLLGRSTRASAVQAE